MPDKIEIEDELHFAKDAPPNRSGGNSPDENTALIVVGIVLSVVFFLVLLIAVSASTMP